MLKVIFLDIDGVLNISWTKKWNTECVNNLNTILLLTKAKIVVTSTWRYNYDIDQLRKIFVAQGIIGEILDATPKLKTDRGIEILDWLDKNPVNDYVVVDDKTDSIEPFIDPAKVFKVDQFVGLKDIKTKIGIIFTLADKSLTS